MATSKIPRKHFLAGLGGIFLGIFSLMRLGGRYLTPQKSTRSTSGIIKVEPDPRSVARVED
jgi:hypothetical protein